MTRILRCLAAAAIGASATAAVALAPAAAASAPAAVFRPNCDHLPTKLLDDSNVEVYCASGHGAMFRAYVKCTGTSTVFFGGWEAYGRSIPSFAHCPTNKFVIEGGSQGRNVGDLFKISTL